MRIFCNLVSLTKSCNGPVQLLPRVASLILQATPHWKNKQTTFPNTIYGGALKSKNLRLSFSQKRLDQTSQWQCGTLRIPLEWFAKSLWDPQLMKYFVCFPQRKYTDCGSCVWRDNISWLVLWSIQQFTSHWKWNALVQVHMLPTETKGEVSVDYCCVHWDWARQRTLLSHCDWHCERHMWDHYGSSCWCTNGLHLLWGVQLYGLWCCKNWETNVLTPSFAFEPSQMV